MGLCTARVILFLAVFLLAEEVTARRKKCPAKTSLATFNAAFVPFYPGVGGPEIEERTELLIQQIDNSGVDIICLQEVLFADVQRQIYRGLKDKYPFILSALNLSTEGESPERACVLQELQQVGACSQMECAGLEGDSFTGCFALRCVNASASVSPRCRDCLSLYSIAGQQTECLSLPASRFETSYGLMLLSTKELKDGRASPFNPQSQFRGYLEASVDDVGDLVCAHLTALLSTIIYGGPPIVSPYLYSNYDEQQYDELITLFDVATSVETPILMGDFNNGPASPGENFAWEFPFHYGLITARGFVSPYVLEDGRCTFCVDNPSVDFPFNLVIDHVYLTTDAYKGRVLSAERFLDDVSTANGSPLSDHFGVVVTLKDIRFNCRWWENRLFYCPAERLQLEQLSPPLAELNRLCAAASG